MNLVMSVNQDYGEGAGKLHISRRTDHHFESHQYGNRHISGWNLFCCKVSLGDVCVWDHVCWTYGAGSLRYLYPPGEMYKKMHIVCAILSV